MNSARLVIMRTLRPGFLICMAFYGVASTIHQSLASTQPSMNEFNGIL